jgi:hypothetical protein
MNQAERQTKIVDLPGDWKAEIARPQLWVALRWNAILRNEADGPRIVERGKEGEEAKANDFTWQQLKLWQEEVYPHCVLSFFPPSGEKIEPSKVWLGDLGFARLWRLMAETTAFINEADSFFRPHDEKPE